MSLPMRERGLKYQGTGAQWDEVQSLPMRERGLKLHLRGGRARQFASLPMRERGLKSPYGTTGNINMSRSPCGSVD